MFEVVDDRLHWSISSHVSRHLSHRDEHYDGVPQASFSSSHAQQVLDLGQQGQVLPGHSEYAVLRDKT